MPIEHMDMKHPKIIVAGIGPGNESDMTPAVISALQESDVVVGYKYYFQFVIPYLHPSTACIDTGMKRERARAWRGPPAAWGGASPSAARGSGGPWPWDFAKPLRQ